MSIDSSRYAAPLVSIGLPVYNGAATIRHALETLLAQSHEDFELIISDNASTDATAAICREYAARDARIRIIGQERNMEACWNFWFALQQARGEFFMWAAADDWWHRDFIKANLDVLLSRRDVIASMSKVKFFLGKKPFRVPAGTYPLMGSPRENIHVHLGNPQMAGRMYALFRTHVLRRCTTSEQFWAYDICLIAKTLKYGKYFEVDRVLHFRDLLGESSGMIKALKRYSRTLLDRLLPSLEMTKRILADGGIEKDPLLLLTLVKYNLEYVLRVAFQYIYPSQLLKKIRRSQAGNHV